MPPKTKKRSTPTEGTTKVQVQPAPEKTKKRKITDRNIQHLLLNGTTKRKNVTTIKTRQFYNSSILQSVQIHENSGINCIAKSAFENCTSLQSVHLADTIKKIEESAFANCTSLLSIHIPNDITTIAYHTFYNCSSLRAVHLPNNVTSIEAGAFDGCASLQSIYIPDSNSDSDSDSDGSETNTTVNTTANTAVTIGMCALAGCDKLHWRQRDGANYDANTKTWLRRRFDSLPVHRACCYINDAQSTVDTLSSLVARSRSRAVGENEHERALVATDAMGMTALHILCCNPRATVEMVQLLVESFNSNLISNSISNGSNGDPNPSSSSSLLSLTDVTGSTPLQLFLECRLRRLFGGSNGNGNNNANSNDNNNDRQVQVQQETESLSLELSPSLELYDFLKRGISSEDLTFLLILNDNPQFVSSWRSKDETTNLFSFMTAATLSSCDLDVVYTLAMRNLDVIVS